MIKTVFLLVLLFTVGAAGAHPAEANGDSTPGEEAGSLWNAGRPDSHAPITVMVDHTHRVGGLMLSYRYMTMEMGGFLEGTSERSSQDIFDAGYMVAPTRMSMHMHMLGAMYAPKDLVTLAAMINYQKKSMDHLAKPGSMVEMNRGETFTNSVDGWGDLALAGMFKVYDAKRQRIHLTLGLSIPVGELNEKYYPMQTSTGTWDLLPSATWLWQATRISGGVQVNGRIHFDQNDYGYTYGDRIQGTPWAAYTVAHWLSLSGRIAAEYIGRIDGVDGRVEMIMAPPMDATNSGGTYVEVGIGANVLLSEVLFKSSRLAAEYVLPAYQDVNGLQI